MRRDFRRSFTTLGITFLVAAGCKSSGPDRLDNVVRGLKETRDGVVQGQKQIDTVTAALEQLVNQPQADLRPVFQKFTTELANTNSLAADIRSRAESMRTRGSEHLAAWEAEMANISNPQIRSISEERRNAVRAKIDTLATNMRGARESFQPFIKNLEEIQKALSNDLTGGGIAAITPTAKEAVVYKTTVQENLTAVANQLDDIAKALASAPPAAPPPAGPTPASGPAPPPAQS